MSIVCKVHDILQNADSEEIETPVKDVNDEDKESLQKQMSFEDLVDSKPCTKFCKTFSTELFKKLMANTQRNCSTMPQGRRHNEIMKKFSLSLLLMTGPSAYNLIHANMPEAFPSLSTVQREANKHYQPIKEGEFLFDKLLAHLDAYNAPRIISVSEDATRVVSRIDYDGKSDSIVGFVLPLGASSLPEHGYFDATSFERIEQMFSTSKKSTNAYVYMAQAMSLTVPPFCLAVIGTDNCFDATVVLNRWRYIIQQCNARNIKVISFGSDGDSRLLTSMRLSIKLHNYLPKQYQQQYDLLNEVTLQSLAIPTSWSSWFSANNVVNTTFVQDPVHLAVKLKARLLTYSQILPMGNFCALSTHLSLVQASFTKEQHNLRAKDLDHQDRQNFEAALRITSPNVLSLLDEIPDSKATKYYLQITRSILECFLSKEMDIVTRIREAWFSLFFVRYWRKWLLFQDEYTLERNFISLNSYLCIEINAHAIIILVLILRAQGSSEYCFPWMLGSQPCERAFRAARSMTPTFSTMINFTVLGLIKRLHKLQIQVDLEAESEATGIIYPHKLMHDKKSGLHKDTAQCCNRAISNKDIEEAVQQGLQKARVAVEELGMKETLISKKQWHNTYGDSQTMEISTKNEDDDSMDIPEEYTPAISDLDKKEIKDVVKNLELLEEKKAIDRPFTQIATKYLCHHSKSESDDKSCIPMYKAIDSIDPVATNQLEKKRKLSNKFVEVDHNGETIYIRKSTLVWLFQEGERVSGDRLFRVRIKQPYSSSLHHIIPAKQLQEIQTRVPQAEEFVELGELCAFINEQSWVIGRIIQFAYYKETLKGSRQYKSTKAPSASSSIGVLCSWFQKQNNEFNISTEKTVSFVYIPITRYICTLSLGCIDLIEGTKNTDTYVSRTPTTSALYTASQFRLHQKTIETINLRASERDMKQNSKTNKAASSSKASNIMDLTKDNDVVEVDKAKIWITCCGFILTTQERNSLVNGSELSDRLINASCAVLKKQFPEFGGLQSTLLQQRNIGMTNCVNAMQILHLSGRNHWAVISTIGCDINSVNYYDSIFDTISMETGKIIANLLKARQSINVNIMNVASQKGSTDCGLYCIAYCTSLAYKANPCLHIFSQSEMRLHLKSCLETEHFTEFPVLKRRRLAETCRTIHILSICPICRKPYDGEKMVSCDVCKEWYHEDCVPPFDDNLDWMCSTCNQKQPM